jgi:hypothetical protein
MCFKLPIPVYFLRKEAVKQQNVAFSHLHKYPFKRALVVHDRTILRCNQGPQNKDSDVNWSLAVKLRVLQADEGRMMLV